MAEFRAEDKGVRWTEKAMITVEKLVLKENLCALHWDNRKETLRVTSHTEGSSLKQCK